VLLQARLHRLQASRHGGAGQAEARRTAGHARTARHTLTVRHARAPAHFAAGRPPPGHAPFSSEGFWRARRSCEGFSATAAETWRGAGRSPGGAGGSSRAGPLWLARGWVGCVPCALVANPEVPRRVKGAWMWALPATCQLQKYLI